HLDAGIGLTISANVFESNDVSLNLGSNDGWDVSGLDFYSNTLRKSNEGASRAYTGVASGYPYGQVHNVRFFDMRLDNGATLNFPLGGYGTKDYSIASLVNVAVQNSGGALLAGATVTIIDRDGNTVFTGTTGADGRAPSVSF